MANENKKEDAKEVSLKNEIAYCFTLFFERLLSVEPISNTNESENYD